MTAQQSLRSSPPIERIVSSADGPIFVAENVS